MDASSSSHDGELVSKVAHSYGYDVLLTPDGAAFQVAYTSGKPDLILLDLQMPGTDDVEFLRILAELGCTAPIPVMSGFDAKVIDTARRLGAARGLQLGRVLTKPIRAADLRDILSEFKQGLASHVD